MTDSPALRVADLPQNRPTTFDIQPDTAMLKELANDLGLRGLRKMKFAGKIEAQDRRDWILTGTLGATALQTCVITLDPVTTRIDIPVKRHFLAGAVTSDEPEVEMPEDDNVEPLESHIDPYAIMSEALALALPQYPRKESVELGEAVYTEPGQEPMRDEDTRPFAGLADLQNQLKKDQ
ncbi:DUF177 domain-containing protein [Parasedimentitalea marina]|uniref:DUF177 domain-containing protein n=1 Tax=Parasedimentitalea marina TaxID=2483033 RepID=A0A3T0N237_9RHOB|nr:DUF177 domain-containing protein [Parasedimentitalea marina]AZV78086.1 DUF177 domain-containing protein [Parasedimentitalea marina]